MKTRLCAALAIIATTALTATPAGAAKPKASCVTALDAAEQIIVLNTEYAGHVGDFFDQLGAAAQNAADGVSSISEYIDDSTSAIKDLTADTRDVTGRMHPIVRTYRTNADKCRSGR